MAWLGKALGNVQQLGQRAAAELNEAAHTAQRRIAGKRAGLCCWGEGVLCGAGTVHERSMIDTPINTPHPNFPCPSTGDGPAGLLPSPTGRSASSGGTAAQVCVSGWASQHSPALHHCSRSCLCCTCVPAVGCHDSQPPTWHDTPAAALLETHGPH